MARKTRRKRNTALVFNPAGSGRRLSIGGAKTNPRRRRRKATRRRRRNPLMMTKATRRRSNPLRRKRNPIGSFTGLISAAVMAAVGVSIFDVVAMKVAPAQQGLMRTGIKAAGAWAVMSYGNKIPILGKYKSEIALVLATAAAIDVLKIYVFPMVAQVANGVIPNLIPAGDDTTAGIYGNAPVYSPYGRFS